MSRLAFWLNAGAAVGNFVLGTAFAIDGRVPWVNASAALLSAGCAYINSDKHKEKRNGRHRQAEEGARDPGPGSFSGSSAAVSLHSAGAVTAADIQHLLRQSIRGQWPYATGGNIPGGVDPATGEVVERVQSDMPILAHRICRLILRGDGKPFVPLHKGDPFGVEAVASCAAYRSAYTYTISTWGDAPTRHSAPALHCSCGFYSLPADVEPWDTGSCYVTLQVELSGTVIEHERGYRSSHQYVLQARLAPCPFCQSPSEVGLFDNEGTMIGAACEKHAAVNVVAVSLDDLSRSLGVPVLPAGGSVSPEDPEGKNQ